MVFLLIISCNQQDLNREEFTEKLHEYYNQKNIVQLDTVFFDKNKMMVRSSDTVFLSRALLHYYFLGFSISELKYEKDLNLDSLGVYFSASDSTEIFNSGYKYSHFEKLINTFNNIIACKDIYTIHYNANNPNFNELLMDQYLGYARGGSEYEYEMFFINEFLLKYCYECYHNQKSNQNRRIYLDTLLDMRDIFESMNFPNTTKDRDEIRNTMTEIINYGFKSYYLPKGADFEKTKVYIDPLNQRYNNK